MNKLCCLIIMLLISRINYGQVLCIYCYDQNDTISANINNLISNGGFENGCGGNGNFCPNSSGYNCDITDWTCSGGGIDTYTRMYTAFNSVIPEGTKAPYFGNQHSNSCSPILYDTSCLNSTLCTVTGIPAGYPISSPNYGGSNGVSLEQTVAGLIVGNTYILEFWVGGEYYGAVPWQAGLFAVDIGFGKIFMRDKETWPTYTLNPDTIGTRYIIEFNAISSSHIIKFTNWGHMCYYCTELVLDDVRLYTLAELDASVPPCTIGIDSQNFQDIENLVFPNLFTTELNVKINSNGLQEIILYDIASRKILNQSFTNSISINTEQLAKGIYIYEVRNKNGVIKKGKVLKD